MSKSKEMQMAREAERIVGNQIHHDPYDGLHRLAVMAGAGNMNGHPMGIAELADRIADEPRNRVFGKVLDRERDMLAIGHAELTDRDGVSVVVYHCDYNPNSQYAMAIKAQAA
jgi:hypothetical protein